MRPDQHLRSRSRNVTLITNRQINDVDDGSLTAVPHTLGAALDVVATVTADQTGDPRPNCKALTQASHQPPSPPSEHGQPVDDMRRGLTPAGRRRRRSRRTAIQAGPGTLSISATTSTPARGHDQTLDRARPSTRLASTLRGCVRARGRRADSGWRPRRTTKR